MSENKDMLPMSKETVEVEGVYENEEGRELYLQKGEEFPSDIVLGKTEWQLTEFALEDHSEGRTDERLVPKKDGTNT